MIDPEAGKATRFSNTNQPPNEHKRVPKYKTKLKKYFIENLPIIEDQMKKGNFQFWQACKEWVYGKEPNIIEGKLEITDNLKKMTKEEIEAELNKIDGK